MRDKSRYVMVGTGGWVHAAGTAAASHAEPAVVVETIHSLDPRALAPLVDAVGHAQSTTFVGISESRTTLETELLMDTFAEFARSMGANPVDHLLWLSPTQGPDVRSVDPAITPAVRPGALFGAPLTLAFLLPLRLVAGHAQTKRYYESFLAAREVALNAMVERALEIDITSIGGLYFFVDPALVNDSLRRWLLQLGRQALSSKVAGFQPKVLVGSAPPAEFEIIDTTAGLDGPPAVIAMLAMHAVQHFIAVLCYRIGAPFATHRAVRSYKRILPALLERAQPPAPEELGANDIEQLERSLIGSLSRSLQRRFAEIVIYRSLDALTARRLEERLTQTLSRPCHVFEGSDWNHHSYQAAWADSETDYAIIDSPALPEPIAGLCQDILDRNVRALSAIANATRATLRANAQ